MSFLERLKLKHDVKRSLRKARVERRQICGIPYVWVDGVGDAEEFLAKARAADVPVPTDIAVALDTEIARKRAGRERAKEALSESESVADDAAFRPDVVHLDHKWGRY